MESRVGNQFYLRMAEKKTFAHLNLTNHFDQYCPDSWSDEIYIYPLSGTGALMKTTIVEVLIIKWVNSWMNAEKYVASENAWSARQPIWGIIGDLMKPPLILSYLYESVFD